MIIEGSCHCGNLTYLMRTRRTRETLAPRACDCSFCRRHDAKSASDPDGSVAFRIRDPAAVSRYRFGLRTADFLVCRDCGIYVGAVIERDGRQWAIVNLRASEFYDVPVAAVSYDAENEAGRFDRRRSRWTPVRARAGE
jgi:hypothetical protein